MVWGFWNENSCFFSHFCHLSGKLGDDVKLSGRDSRESIHTIRANRVIRANRKFE